MNLKDMEPATDPNNLSNFKKLGGVEVQTATASEDYIKNVRANLIGNYKKISDLEGFTLVKGHNKPIALVGGGPSLKKELESLREFKIAGFPIIACGSSHDYLISKDIIPDYCTLCDPDPITAAYIKENNDITKYLVALSCDPLVFKVLSNRNVYVWNCRSDEAAPHIEKDLVGHIDILGGCTVGLRTISIAMCLGYTNIHFWGFDSSMGRNSDEHHAYEFATKDEQVGVVYPIRFGNHEENKPDEDSKYYICSGYQLAQAMHFQQFLTQYSKVFTPTFHGEGLLPDFYQYLVKQAEKLSEKVNIPTNVIAA